MFVEKTKIRTPLEYIKQNYIALIITGVTLLVLLVMTFFDVATRETVASFALEEYQVGQISDKTIVADKTLPATEADPIYIVKGEKVIRKGFPITEEGYAKLKKIADSPTYIDFRAFANAFLYLLLLVFFALFLYSSYMMDRKVKPKEMVFLAVSYVIVYTVCLFIKKLPAFYSQFCLATVIPSTFFVILVTILFDSKSALRFSILISLGIFFACSFRPVPSIFQLASSITAIRVVRKTEKRTDMVFASILLSILNVIYLFALSIIVSDETEFSIIYLLYVAANALISGIFALGFLTPLELMLNTASVFRLMDLSDTNSSLMRKMMITCPGTYNHSLMVATLAENACNAIGANSLLARVGGYYHDIGKTDIPEYFVENQQGQNPHNELNPRLSYSIIKSHVKKGIEKANQMRFPHEVVDIIASHHGNDLIKFFHYKAEQSEEHDIPLEEFSYPGPLPSSKEAAVVMLADTVEAACKTLEKPSYERLEKFIHTLVMAKLENHQLDECPLKFSDLDIIEKSFVNILAGYYHSRIKYPDQKDPDAQNPSEKAIPAPSVENDKKDAEKKESKAESEDKKETKDKVRKKKGKNEK
ncbi:MAG: HDIG domain-containing protein [Treponemataceae bacterium]|nr:HDIG domain-containing protein [Treponemataceae bacterium]